MKLNFSKKILILSLVIFIAVLVLDIIFASLLINRVVEINDRVEQLNTSTQKQEKELTLTDFIANSAAERDQLASYFVGAGNAETVYFTKYLEALAKEVGVTEKKTLNYQPVIGLESSVNVSAIEYHFSVSGRWSNVFTFLQMIENLPKVLSLNSVSLSVASEAVSLSEIRSGIKIWTLDLDFSVVNLKN